MKKIFYVSILFMMCVLVLTGCGGKSSGGFGGKKVTYFNNSKTSSDKLSFTLHYGYGTEKNIFMGLTGKGVANTLGNDFFNNVILLSEYNGDELSFHYDDVYYNFELEFESYEEKDGAKYIDNDEIVYNEGPYYITKTGNNEYIKLYYLYDKEEYSSGNESWYVIDMSIFRSLEEAKTQLENIKKNMTVCIYEDDINNCVDADGKKVNYKDYKYIKDLFVDSLASIGLYVDSYENIGGYNHDGLSVYKKSSMPDVDDKNEFRVSFERVNSKLDEKNYIELNGNKWMIYSPYSLYYFCSVRGDNMIEVYTNLPYKVDETKENAVAAFKEAFSK